MGLAPVDESVRAHLKLPKDQGLIVTDLDVHSPAAMARIRQNDVLLKLGEASVGKVEDLEEALKAAGDKPVTLSLLRGGKIRQIQVQPRVQVTLGPVQPEPPEFWIGISVAPMEWALRSQLQLPPNEGLLVIDVVKDSAAAQAGIRVHDIALRLGGKPLTDQGKLVKFVQDNGDKPIAMDLIRGGERLSISLTPHRRKRARLSWQTPSASTYTLELVRPGAVLTVPKDGGGNYGSGVVTGDFNNDGSTDVLTLTNRVSQSKAPQDPNAATAKRLDQMAEEIKQMRQAIEELSKAAKEKR
jgi:C-terminal processing protease CtpA/Prc